MKRTVIILTGVTICLATSGRISTTVEDPQEQNVQSLQRSEKAEKTSGSQLLEGGSSKRTVNSRGRRITQETQELQEENLTRQIDHRGRKNPQETQRLQEEHPKRNVNSRGRRTTREPELLPSQIETSIQE